MIAEAMAALGAAEENPQEVADQLTAACGEDGRPVGEGTPDTTGSCGRRVI